MWGLLSLFVFLPALELYLLISIGTEVGAPATLGLILLTGFIGAGLVRQQGLGVYRRIQAESASGRLPALELLEGLVLLVAGALLLTPGLITDAVGFAALVPSLRRRFAQGLADRVVVGASTSTFRVGLGGFPGGPGGAGPFGPGGAEGANPFGGRPDPFGAQPPFGGGPSSGFKNPRPGAATVVDVESRPVPDDEPRALGPDPSER